MSELKRHERAAIESVTRLYPATWGEDSSGAYLMMAGKRVDVDIKTLKRQGSGQRNSAKPRLRFDKGVNQLMGRLEAILARIVPDGLTVLLTVTAPIRLGLKTAAALETKIRSLLGRGSHGRDVKARIHGNRVRIQLLRHKSEQAPKLIGFVHNPETDALLLLEMSRDLIELLSGLARMPRRALQRGDRWLVLISANGVSRLEVYRYIYSRLRFPASWKKIWLVFADARVAELTG